MMLKIDDIVEITGSLVNGFSVIRIKAGKFAGIEFTYGSVVIQEDELTDSAKMQFEYTLIKGEPENVEEFKVLAGDILLAILEEQLKNEKVIYHGGTGDVITTS